jgi:hypothetical protein
MKSRRLIFMLVASALALPLAGAAPVGNPADFAALTIRPNGPEELDLATGVTTLPEGGTVSYKDEGVTLSGTFIRYLEGEFIEIEGATVEGVFGSLSAPQLRFVVASQRLEAVAGARFKGEALELEAKTITLHLEDDIAVLAGGVLSREPDLTSERAVVDTAANQALLIGPYRFQNGPVTLRGEAGKQLALTWDEAGAVSAGTAIAPDVQSRFAPYLK